MTVVQLNIRSTKTLNSCHHKEDYGISLPLAMAGGTIKCLATRASLQRTVEGQNLNAHDLFEFSSKNIKEIQMFFTPSSEVANEDFLEKRYGKSIQIVGTRENHFFKTIKQKEKFW